MSLPWFSHVLGFLGPSETGANHPYLLIFHSLSNWIIQMNLLLLDHNPSRNIPLYSKFFCSFMSTYFFCILKNPVPASLSGDFSTWRHRVDHQVLSSPSLCTLIIQLELLSTEHCNSVCVCVSVYVCVGCPAEKMSSKADLFL